MAPTMLATKPSRWCSTCMKLPHDAPARVLQRRVSAAQAAPLRGIAGQAHQGTPAAGLPHARELVCRAAVLCRRACAHPAIRHRRAHRAALRALGRARARALDARHRHGLRLHRAGLRQGVSARRRSMARTSTQDALAVADINRRRLRLTRRVRLVEVRPFRGAFRGFVRYHREQSALRRGARDARVAARVSSRAAPCAGVRTRGPRLGRDHPALRRASPAAARAAGGGGGQHRARADARLSTGAVHLARVRARRWRSVPADARAIGRVLEGVTEAHVGQFHRQTFHGHHIRREPRTGVGLHRRRLSAGSGDQRGGSAGRRRSAPHRHLAVRQPAQGRRRGAHPVRRVRRQDHGLAHRHPHREHRRAFARLREDQGSFPSRARGLHLPAEVRLPRLPRRRPFFRARDRHARGGGRHRAQVSRRATRRAHQRLSQPDRRQLTRIPWIPTVAYDNPFFCPDPVAREGTRRPHVEDPRRRRFARRQGHGASAKVCRQASASRCSTGSMRISRTP